MGNSGGAGGGTDVVSATTQSILGGTTTDLVSNGSTIQEISSQLRVTAVVPATGSVIVQQQVVAYTDSGSAGDFALYVSTNGGSTWTLVGSFPFASEQNIMLTMTAFKILTGLTPGSTTFQMGWAMQAGSGNAHILSHTRGGANQNGCWQIIQT